MVPARLSLITYNLWLTERWPARANALERFLKLFAPDVLCVQELQSATQEFLDGTLKTHDRVRDPFSGWTSESNIYWSKALFEKVEHGTEEVGHPEPERRMFWVRLRFMPLPGTIFVATAHLTNRRNPDESESGLSPRVRQLKRIADELTRLVRKDEPAFFMGDMNDAYHPQRILKKAGFVSCFAALGMQSPPTFQCYPTANVRPDEPTVTEAIDLIVANRHARAVAASVPQCYGEDTAPSDHWPVQAIYELV
ncbi:MAG TPA: endonuclease/exonuclease/phosphatase family protein [Candidatus Binatia bacterium]|nr:endonuclease/exonuclease/phosphatase family protein [Candidatus Binatia bacterium]